MNRQTPERVLYIWSMILWSLCWQRMSAPIYPFIDWVFRGECKCCFLLLYILKINKKAAYLISFWCYVVESSQRHKVWSRNVNINLRINMKRRDVVARWRCVHILWLLSFQRKRSFRVFCHVSRRVFVCLLCVHILKHTYRHEFLLDIGKNKPLDFNFSQSPRSAQETGTTTDPHAYVLPTAEVPQAAR